MGLVSRLFLTDVGQKLVIEFISPPVRVVTVCQLNYFVSAFSKESSQFFIFDHLRGCEMWSSINKNQCRSWLSGEIEIDGRNRNFDLRLIMDSRGF